MKSQQEGGSQYDRLVEVLAELRERIAQVVAEAEQAGREGLAAHGAEDEPKPQLVFVYSQRDGLSRRVEGFIAQVLQRRHNHATFDLVRVCVETEPELVERLGVSEVPTLLVVDGRSIAVRLEQPRGAGEIRAGLSRWLK